MANASDQVKQHQLSDFASRYLPDFISLPDQCETSNLTGDAGFRNYYRLNSEPSVLAVDAPPDSEDSLAFVRIATLLRELGVHAPQVYAANLVQGMLLVEDFGEQSYQDALSAKTAPGLYQDALTCLLRIQSCPERPAWVPHYDEAFLRQEMRLFSTWFVHELLGHEMSEEEAAGLERVYDLLVEAALQQPQVLVHRDYHCRNLMVTTKDNPGVIDFQDAVWGPVTYDAVSLMRDCYLRWTPDRVHEQLAEFTEQLVDRGLITSAQRGQVPGWFDLMGLQRHIKVLGIFARLWLRDGKSGYLDDLPLVLRYVMEVGQQCETTRGLTDWIADRLLPLAQKQDWYRDWRQAGDDRTIW